jgi:hypothetical protein
MPRDFQTFPDDAVAAPIAPRITPDLDGLIMWLERQNPAAGYDWNNCDGRCLIGMFYIAIYGTPYPGDRREFRNVFDGFPENSYGQVCLTKPWTAGAALQRARALRDSRP